MEQTQIFDDGSTFTYNADYSYLSSTPAATSIQAADMVHQTSGGAYGFFDVLNGATDAASSFARSVLAIQAQADGYRSVQMQREIASDKQSAMLQLNKLGIERDLAIARATGGTLNGSTLLLLALGAAALMMASK